MISCADEPRSVFHSESYPFVSKVASATVPRSRNDERVGCANSCVLVSHRDWRSALPRYSCGVQVEVIELKRVERRLLREYLDLPGLNLSLAQAARLVSVDAPTCEVVLNDLVNSHCLAHGESGTYVREARDGDLERWKSLVRNRLAAVTQASPSPTKADRSVSDLSWSGR